MASLPGTRRGAVQHLADALPPSQPHRRPPVFSATTPHLLPVPTPTVHSPAAPWQRRRSPRRQGQMASGKPGHRRTRRRIPRISRCQPPGGHREPDHRSDSGRRPAKHAGRYRWPRMRGRHRPPLRRAELAAVILRGGLHEGPLDSRRGPRVRGAVSGQLAWEGGADQWRHGYPQFHSPSRSHLCKGMTSIFTEIIHRLMHRALASTAPTGAPSRRSTTSSTRSRRLR